MDRGLKRMKKIELLELLLEQEKEIETLRTENNDLKEQLDIQKIKLERSGSIAEAALELSGVFEAAQKAADLYLNSVKTDPEEEKESERVSENEPSDDSGDRDGADEAQVEPKPKE